MAKTVAALYDSLTDARAALQELVSEGFERSEISLIANASNREMNKYFDEEGQYVGQMDVVERDDDSGEEVAAGAGIGATIGGVGGLLVGLGLLTVPGVGPALAAGPLASALVGAGVGGVAGGLLGALVSAGIPEEEAHRYAEGVRRGGTLLLVNATDERAADAAEILDRHQALDIDSREASWRNRGWERHDPAGEPLEDRQLAQEREHIEVPIVEEDVRVGKREVERGGVRARTFVSEHPVEKQVRLRDESVEVHREPADRPVAAGDEAFRERQVEMRETDEEAVVEKEARVVEEVVIDKRATERNETVRDSARRTEVDIEEFDDDTVDDDFSRYERTFRGHFQDSDISARYSYDDVMPAYRFGYSLASSSHYRGRNWEDVEPEARRAWEEKNRGTNRGTWEDIRDSVQHSWREVRKR